MSRTELIQELNKTKEEIHSLRNQLYKMHEQKESFFKKKEALKKEIIASITEIKTKKSDKGHAQQNIQELKKQRDMYNKEVQELVKEIKIINKEKEKITQRYSIRTNPSQLKEELHRLELKIETEAPSFDQEKKLMKQINALKKQVKEFETFQGIFDKANELSEKINKAKEKAQQYHTQLQSINENNKDSLKGMMDTSEKIANLKREQETAFQKFLECKQQFAMMNAQLKEKIEQNHILKETVMNLVMTEREKRERQQQQILEAKTREVEEKLKKKQKLTTNDLIALQG